VFLGSHLLGSNLRLRRRALLFTSLSLRALCSIDRDRGKPHSSAPPIPPDMRVRIRRFESVALTLLDQRGKSERPKVRIGEPPGEGLGPGQIPRAVAAARGVAREPRRNPRGEQSSPATLGVFHCRHTHILRSSL
jgi:hypothetical protein